MTAQQRAGHKHAPKFPPIRAVNAGADPRFQANARCGLAVATVFDERQPGETTGAYYQRCEQARGICAGCPVRQGCAEFGTSNKLSGWCGGQYLVDGEPRSPRHRARA